MYFTKTNAINNSSEASITSGSISVQGAKSIKFIFERSNHSAGSHDFSVEASADGVNWIPFKMLIDNASNNNTENLTRIETKSLSANGTDFVSVASCDKFEFFRVKATRNTDGDCSAWVYCEY